MRVEQVVRILEHVAPPELAESWDKVGLMVGQGDWSMRTATLCIDLTEKVMAEAVHRKVGLIIAYHPLIFVPLTRLTDADWKQRVVLEAARRRIAVYSPHTALDATKGGVNDWLAAGMGSGEVRAIRPSDTANSKQCKLVTFVPEASCDAVRDAIATVGAGRIGDYAQCSFSVEGIGTFVGGESTRPAVGQSGRLEQVRELRIEMVFPKAVLSAVINALIRSHPYEEPAFDVYPLHPVANADGTGQGRIVSLDRPVKLAPLVSRIKRLIGVSKLEVAKAIGRTRPVRVIGLCAGAGGSLLEEAGDIDLFLTGEMRHHAVLDAVQRGVTVVLAGHTQMERAYLPRYRQRIKTAGGGKVSWLISSADRAPSELV